MPIIQSQLENSKSFSLMRNINIYCLCYALLSFCTIIYHYSDILYCLLCFPYFCKKNIWRTVQIILKVVIFHDPKLLSLQVFLLNQQHVNLIYLVATLIYDIDVLWYWGPCSCCCCRYVSLNGEKKKNGMLQNRNKIAILLQ